MSFAGVEEYVALKRFSFRQMERNGCDGKIISSNGTGIAGGGTKGELMG